MSNPTQTPAATPFAAREPYSFVDVGGYSWMILPRSNGSIDLRPHADPQLGDVLLHELPGVNGGAPTYGATVRAPGIYDLVAKQDGFADVEAALAWATTFAFPSRRAGSVVWRAPSADSGHWYALIGASVATIFRLEMDGSDSYTVKRQLMLGTQSVELSISDLPSRDRPKSIVSFEQASAIALTMTDYVLELMRTAPAEGASNA